MKTSSLIALLFLSSVEATKLSKKATINNKLKNKDWSDVAATSNSDDYAGSQANAMQEVTIFNPSEYSVSEDQVKAQENKYKEDEAKAMKEVSEREAAFKKQTAIDDSLATVNDNMQAMKKMQMDVKVDQAQHAQTNEQSAAAVAAARVQKIAHILATATTDEQQKDELEAVDGKKPSHAQK